MLLDNIMIDKLKHVNLVWQIAQNVVVNFIVNNAQVELIKNKCLEVNVLQNVWMDFSVVTKLKTANHAQRIVSDAEMQVFAKCVMINHSLIQDLVDATVNLGTRPIYQVRAMMLQFQLKMYSGLRMFLKMLQTPQTYSIAP